MIIEGKVVLITGASGGFGGALAREFARARSRIALCGRDRNKLDSLAEELRSDGAMAEAFVHDLCDLEGAPALVETVESRLGPVAVLINNAGGATTGLVADIPVAEFIEALRSNLLGAIALTKAALPRMLERKDGSIVFISSGAALRALPAYAPYSAAKAGLSAFADSLRAELRGCGVTVITIYPGKLATQFDQRSRRYGEPLAAPRGGGSLPARIAKRVLRAVRNDKSIVMIRGAAWAAAWLGRLAPALVDRILAGRAKMAGKCPRR